MFVCSVAAEGEGWCDSETFSSFNLNAVRKKNAPRGDERSERLCAELPLSIVNVFI